MNLSDQLELASAIAKDLRDLAAAELDVGGFRPYDVYSVVPGPVLNQFQVTASRPGSESPKVVFKVTIEPV